MSLRIIALSVLLTSCAATVSGSCQNPVQDACSEKASEISVGLAKASAKSGKTLDEVTTEFMTACEGQLQGDLDQTASDITQINADGGVQP